MVCFLAGELGLVWVNMFHGVPHTADDSERACLQRDNGGGCSSATIISMESTLFNVHPEVPRLDASGGKKSCTKSRLIIFVLFLAYSLD